MEMKEWFVVYRWYDTSISTRLHDSAFIYGHGTAQDAWNEFKDPRDNLISITRV